MKDPQVYVYLILLTLLSCSSEKKEIQGAWSLRSDAVEDRLPAKFRAMFLFDLPYVYEEEIYITDTLMEYPLGFSEEGTWPQRNFLSAQAKGNKMVIDRDTVDFEFTGENLFIENLCFIRADTGIGMKLKYVDLQIKHEGDLSLGLRVEESGEFNLYHSVLKGSSKGVFSSEAMDYLAKLSRRLDREQLNRIYNVGISHAREYELFVVLNDESFKVITFGLEGKLPFEIRALIHNLIEAIGQEMKDY